MWPSRLVAITAILTSMTSAGCLLPGIGIGVSIPGGDPVVTIYQVEASTPWGGRFEDTFQWDNATAARLSLEVGQELGVARAGEPWVGGRFVLLDPSGRAAFEFRAGRGAPGVTAPIDEPESGMWRVVVEMDPSPMPRPMSEFARNSWDLVIERDADGADP